jgi:flagellar capping protein FliD
MINTESLEKILRKKRDKIPALLEVLNLIGKLCEIDDKKFNNIVNTALDKVENLLYLKTQCGRTSGYVLTTSDYKSLGIFENHLEKLRRKSKKSPLKIELLKLMPKLYQIKQSRHLNYTELQEYLEKKYKIYVSRTYFTKIYKTIN